MSLQVLQFEVVVPAGTPKATPATTDLDVDNWEITLIEAEVPPGPSGTMGFYLANNGVQWVPRTAGTFLVWDDRSAAWEVTGQPNASGWQLVGYNTGVYDHAVYLRMHVDPPATAADTGLPPTVVLVNSPPATDNTVTL